MEKIIDVQRRKPYFFSHSVYSFLLALILCSTLPTLAQVRILGSVKSEHSQPVPFANILLLLPQDSSLVMGTITSADGEFSLHAQPGDYLLKASMIGYQPVLSLIKVGDTRQTMTLDPISLVEDAKQLDEIVVTGQKPLFEKQIDRTVVNVQSSITSVGSTALQVLEKSPGVVVNRQNNSIAMSGKTGVLVMINGKVSRLPMDAVIQMLDGMSSANIETIELITTPPAKYDAEGNAGIIHIVLTKNPDIGFNGNAGVNLGYKRDATLATNINLNHRSKSVYTFFDYAINHERNRHEWINEHYITVGDFTQSNISGSNRKPVTTIQNLRAGLEYNLNDKITLSLLVTGYRRNWEMDAQTTNLNAFAADSTLITEMSVNEINRWQSATGSIGLTKRLDDRQELSLSFDYLYYHNNNPSSYNNNISSGSSFASESEFIQVEKLTPINFKIASLDYTNKVNANLSMDAGIKGTVSHFTNTVTVMKLTQGEMKIDPELTNSSNLNEKIMAAYWSWKWKPSMRWNIDGGLRYEHTQTILTTPSGGELVNRNFGTFFPSLFIAYSFNEESKIQMSYNKRITRPTFNDMAPFVFFIGPNTSASGNLSLRPAISNGIDLTYLIKQWSVSVRHSYSKNDIVILQPEFNSETNEQIFRSQNLKYVQTFGINTTFPLMITPWWEIHNDISFYFHDYKTQHLDNNEELRIKSLTLNSAHTFRLPGNFSAEISGYYQSASLFGIFKFSPMGKLNLGIKKEIKNGGVVTLSVTDLFNTSVWHLKTNVAEANSRSTMIYDWGTRSVNLTYSINFGNSKLKAVSIKSRSEAERKRVQ